MNSNLLRVSTQPTNSLTSRIEKMKFTGLLPTLALIARSLTEEITSDTITRGGFNTKWGTTHVAEGVFWSILDNDVTNFIGDLNVDGELYISAQEDFIGLQVNLGGINNEFIVNGQVVLDSRKTTKTPFYNTKASTFENNGKIWFTGAGDAGIPTMAITSSNWKNNGLLHFYQDYRSGGWVNLGWDLQSIENDGAICLHKMAYRQANTINGNGCIDIGEDSTVWLAYTLYHVDEQQTLVFSGSNGLIKTDAWGKDQTYNVVGFGDENVIGMGVPITSYLYGSSDGILTLSNGLTTFKYNIGTGYDESKFEKITPDYGVGMGKVINGGIKYNGSPVNTERPSSCPVCEEIPEVPTEASSSLIPSSSNLESTTLTVSSIEISAPPSEVPSSETSSELPSSSEIMSSSMILSSSEASSFSEIVSSSTGIVSSTSNSSLSPSSTPSQVVPSEFKIAVITTNITSAITSTYCPEPGLTTIVTTNIIKEVVSTYCPESETIQALPSATIVPSEDTGVKVVTVPETCTEVECQVQTQSTVTSALQASITIATLSTSKETEVPAVAPSGIQYAAPEVSVAPEASVVPSTGLAGVPTTLESEITTPTETSLTSGAPEISALAEGSGAKYSISLFVALGSFLAMFI